jgi:hypothetical protein
LFAECLVENNYYEHVKNPWELGLSIKPGTITGKLHAANNNVSYLETTNGIQWIDGWYNDGVIIAKLIPGTDAVFTPPYSYTLDNASDIQNLVMAHAGNRVTSYLITATSGAHGSVTPIGVTPVNFGNNQSYTITPDVGYSIAMVKVDNISVGAVASYNFINVISNHTIQAEFTSGTVIAPAPFAVGWNLVSVPLILSNDTAAVVFPGSYGDLFKYDAIAGNYVSAPTLAIGPAYWVYYPTSKAISISGTAVSGPITILCHAGWNLIGSREVSVLKSTLTTNPAGQIFGDMFSYSGGSYVPTSTLVCGSGAWIYVLSTCSLTIP